MSEDAFLARCGWAHAEKVPLAGDASSRRYTRLSTPTGNSILMDAGSGSGAGLARFSLIARHLRALGLSAPDILATDEDRFLLIEDLGDAVFARVIEQTPKLEVELYQAAIDALIVSQSGPIPDVIKAYGSDEMLDAIGLAFEWYPTPQTRYADAEVDTLKFRLKTLMDRHLSGPNVLIQRDFHAENLIWLPNRTGPARVGLLDFQDAVFGHPAYDLASLLVDARRDVSPKLRDEMIGYYCARTNSLRADFETAFFLCSAQRNLRILGIFARLTIRDKKTGYVDLIPRVWRNLLNDLTHPDLLDLKAALTSILPEPTSDVLAQIGAANV